MVPRPSSGFDKFCAYCNKFVNLIPLSFVLGFYVTLIVNRWWVMWDNVPWPDDVVMIVSALITGQVRHRLPI
jgi:hypothetical protein